MEKTNKSSPSTTDQQLLPNQLPLTLFSDIQCPWCFIAKKRLDPILQSSSGAYIKLLWRPLELHPYIPFEGMDSHAFFHQYMGDDKIIQEQQAHVTRIGVSLGIQMDFSRMRKQPNTRLAHRLIAYAEDHGAAQETTEALFQGFFCEGVDIGNAREILSLLKVKSVPLEQAQVNNFLNSNEGEAQLKRDLDDAQTRGITGAPTYMRSDGLCSGSFQTGAEVHAFLNNPKGF